MQECGSAVHIAGVGYESAVHIARVGYALVWVSCAYSWSGLCMSVSQLCI